MDGRIEYEQRIMQKTKELYKGKPQFLKQFVMYMYSDGKAKNTAYEYLYITIGYLDFIAKESNTSIELLKIEDISDDMLDLYLIKNEYHTRKKTGELVKISDDLRMHEFFALKSFYAFMLERHYIEYDPFKNKKSPKVDWRNKPVIVMNESEINELFDKIENGAGSELSKKRQKDWKTRDKAIMTVFLATAYRASACANLDVNNIDFQNNIITSIDKGGKVSKHYLSESVIKILREWLLVREKFLEGYPPCNALFISNQRKRMCTKAMSKLLDKYTAEIDKPLTLHKLRSTSANIVHHACGGDVKITKEHLNHANYTYIDRYTTTPVEKKKEVANILSEVMKF